MQGRSASGCADVRKLYLRARLLVTRVGSGPSAWSFLA